MSGKAHTYALDLSWTCRDGETTRNYLSYSRSHTARIDGKPDLELSADTAFRGTAQRWNPEDMLVASLSSCHMLSFLAIASLRKIEVLSYEDSATGTMEQDGPGGRFTDVTLHPLVVVEGDVSREVLDEIHDEAHHVCFIANSVNFPVNCAPRYPD